MRSIAKATLPVLIGCIFLFSGIAKIIDKESFDFEVYKLLPSYEVASILAIFIICLEICLGLLFVFRIYFHEKWLIKFSLGLLIVFSAYLGYEVSKGNTQNCQCFGELVSLSPAASLVKNGLIILALLWTLKYSQSFAYSGMWRKYILIACTVISISLGLLMYVLQVRDIEYYAQEEQKDLQLSDLKRQHPSLQMYTKNVVAFFSATCPHCFMVGKQLALLQQNHTDVPTLAFINGTPHEVSIFLKETGIDTNTAFTLLGKAFTDRAGYSLPVIYLTKHDTATAQIRYIGSYQTDLIKSW